MKKTFFLITLFSIFAFAESNRVKLDRQKGKYPLNFDAIYVLYVHNDIETSISLPPGFIFTGSMPGSIDYISVGTLQNTVYISKPVVDNIRSNLTLHVITPEGMKKKLVIEVIGKRNSPRVLSVDFTKPNSSELNQTIEHMKATYSEQLDAKLSAQERKLKEIIPEDSFKRSRPLFFGSHRGQIKESYKGASVWVDGVISSESDSYIYISSNIKFDNCNVIELLGVSVGQSFKGKAELVSVEQLNKTVYYVYKTNRLPVKKKTNIGFLLKIWSKTFKLKSKVS